MLKERPEFYKEEIRCGYTVDEKTKRVWAVQLEMLDEVERICKANGLKYFADSGTLIGTIRHEGYIPWDDDIDLVMLREDYDQFVQIAPDWLKEDLVLQTVYTEKIISEGMHRYATVRPAAAMKKIKKRGITAVFSLIFFPWMVCRIQQKEEKSGRRR